jgi:hypothetical protein
LSSPSSQTSAGTSAGQPHEPAVHAGSSQSATPLQSLSAPSVQSSAICSFTFGFWSLQSVPPHAWSPSPSPSRSRGRYEQMPLFAHRARVHGVGFKQSESMEHRCPSLPPSEGPSFLTGASLFAHEDTPKGDAASAITATRRWTRVMSVAGSFMVELVRWRVNELLSSVSANTSTLLCVRDLDTARAPECISL